uniref:Uncharacterized protein n=1 Tax=Triticum urartu TaxID=4572 RepID=A0A8R7VEG6_TRIUA
MPTAAAAHEDAVGVDCERHHPRAGFITTDAIEEGEGEGGPISADFGGRRTGEGGKEAVEGAPGDRGGLPQQFVEQVVCIVLAERPSADALCCRGKGGAGRPGTQGPRGGGVEAAVEVDAGHRRGGGAVPVEAE